MDVGLPVLSSKRPDGPATPLLLIGVVAIGLCCAAPVLVGALLATGVGAALAAAGSPALGIGVAAVGGVALVWRSARRRRACDSASDVRPACKGIR